MKILTVVLWSVSLIFGFSNIASAAPPNQTSTQPEVTALSGKCFQIKANNDYYLSEASLSAQRDPNRAVNAYFQATDLGEYILYFSDNPNGAANLGLGYGYMNPSPKPHFRDNKYTMEVRSSRLDPYAQKDFRFKVTAYPSSSSNTLVSFESVRELEAGRPAVLSGNYSILRFSPPANSNGAAGADQLYELVPVSSSAACQQYPEMQPPAVDKDYSNNPNALTNNGNSVRGWIDAHNHVTSYQGYGGRLFHGSAFATGGPAEALQDSEIAYGENATLDLIGGAVGGGGLFSSTGTKGWPTFEDWPKAESLTYGQYYYLWLERAYLSGQRMMVVDFTENEVLCEGIGVVKDFAMGRNRLTVENKILQLILDLAATAITFVVGGNFENNIYDCNITNSITRQAETLRHLERYIEAKSGSADGGFFKIVTSPSEARAVIAAGKMAVIMGLEASEALECGVRDAPCTRQIVDERLDYLHDLGIRGMFLVHKYDNQFGGTHIDNSFVNFGNRISTGQFFNSEECPAGVASNESIEGPPTLDLPGGFSIEPGLFRHLLSALYRVDIDEDELDYDPDAALCNKRGLTPIGAYLVNRMIDKKMLIEVDHASFKAAESIMDIAEARQYSGVLTTHNWTHNSPDSPRQIGITNSRILNLGGFVSLITAPKFHENVMSASNYITQNTNFLGGVGIGPDFSGIHSQPSVGTSFYGNVQYPYVSEFGFRFDKQPSGTKTWDYNQDGLAHYGMLADFIQDLRVNRPEVYEVVMNSAETYLQMWERAVANSNDAYANTAQPIANIISSNNIANDIDLSCIDVKGQLMSLANGTPIQANKCSSYALDQQWIYNSETRELQSLVDPSYCLHRNGARLTTENCSSQSKSPAYWRFYKNRLADASNVLAPRIFNYDSNYAEDGDQKMVSLLRYDYSAQSRWILTPESDFNRKVLFHSVNGSETCLGVNGRDMTPQMQPCEGRDYQHWYYDTKTDTLKTRVLDTERCLQAQDTSPRHGTRLKLAVCNTADARQKFVRDGLSFRSKANPAYALDNNGGGNGLAPVLYRYSATSINQQWVAGLSFRSSDDYYAPSNVTNLVGQNDRGWLADLGCQANEVLVGIKGRVGWAIDQMGITCARTDDSGNWIGAAEGPSSDEIYGGNGGSEFNLTCPSGQAVASLDVWQGYRSNSANLGAIQLGCRNLSSKRAVSGNTNLGARAGQSGTTFSGKVSCSADKAASGLVGRFDGLFYRLGLRCYN